MSEHPSLRQRPASVKVPRDTTDMAAHLRGFHVPVGAEMDIERALELFDMAGLEQLHRQYHGAAYMDRAHVHLSAVAS